MVLLLKPLETVDKPLDVLLYGFPTRRVVFPLKPLEPLPSSSCQCDTFTCKVVLLLKPLKNAVKPLDVLPYGLLTRRVVFPLKPLKTVDLLHCINVNLLTYKVE